MTSVGPAAQATEADTGLRDGIAELGLDLTAQTRARLLDYLDELLRWNRRINLTAVRDRDEAIVKHLLDSLAVAPYCRPGRILDVGSGGGLPGVVLALARPDVRVVSVDARGRKIAFQKHVARTLGLSNLDPRHARVEDLGAESFTQVISRAFASLADFTALAGERVEAGGEMLAMKGRRPDSELAALAPPWKPVKIDRLFVPGLADERHLVVLRRDPA